jgi:Cys-tRNA(Pro) deacylase
MEPSADTPVTNYLNREKTPYRLFRHAGPIHSLEQAARERGQLPDQVVRSIVFRTGTDQYIMVLMPGPRQVSWPALRQYLAQSRLTMASEEEVLKATQYQIGAVSPFGLPKPMRILVDSSVLEQNEISIGSGERGLTVILKTEDMLQALRLYELSQFARTENQG